MLRFIRVFNTSKLTVQLSFGSTAVRPLHSLQLHVETAVSDLLHSLSQPGAGNRQVENG